MQDQADEADVVDGQVMPEEAATAIDTFIPEPAVADASDRQEVMIRMDEHDVRQLMVRVQSGALRKWVYDMDGKQGLSIHGVQDIAQQMNWTGKCRISALPDTLTVEQIEADEGNGPEPFWVATIFAEDGVTGMRLPGSSMEPQRMRLKAATADRKRRNGSKIPEDNAVFDRFARWKAIQKATRNALGGFIPEEVEQTIIAMFAKDPSRVERIQTEQEQKVADMPPPLTDDRAKVLIAECQGLYDLIRECAGGQGKVKMPPGMFAAWMLQSQHDHGALERFRDYLRERLEKIPFEVELEARKRECLDTAQQVACPVCEQPPRQFCKGVRGHHQERVAARWEQMEAGR